MKFQGLPKRLYEKNIVILFLLVNSFEKSFDRWMWKYPDKFNPSGSGGGGGFEPTHPKRFSSITFDRDKTLNEILAKQTSIKNT